MENPHESIPAASFDAPKKRPRLRIGAQQAVVSSDQIETQEPEIIDPNLENTPEEPLLLHELEQDPDELDTLGHDSFIEDSYTDDEGFDSDAEEGPRADYDLDDTDGELGEDFDEAPAEDQEFLDLFGEASEGLGDAGLDDLY